MVSQSNQDDHVRVDLDAELSAAGRRGRRSGSARLRRQSVDLLRTETDC
jgi:hypothetical protein